MKSLEFVQDPIPGISPEYSNPLARELAEAFKVGDQFTIDNGLYAAAGITEPSQPTYREHKTPDGKVVFASVGTEFESRFKRKSIFDVIKLQIDADKDVLRGRAIETTISTIALIHPRNDQEVVFAQAGYALNPSRELSSQRLSISHTLNRTKPMDERIDIGFAIEYLEGGEIVRGGDTQIEAMTRAFVQANTTNEHPGDRSLPMDIGHLILTGQIISLLQEIAK